MDNERYDKLTGFYNKSSAASELLKACRNETGALLIIDLDNFKLVNDIYGLGKGDELLRAFADVIRDNTRSNDIIGRNGGDEFVVFCVGVNEERDVSGLSRRINEQLLQEALKILGEDMSIPLGVSMGAVFAPKEGTDFDDLFDKADKALYYVKLNGKHSYSLFGGRKENTRPNAVSTEEDIKHLSEMMGEQNPANCAFWLGQDAFSSVYKFMLRYIESYRGGACKVLFTLKPISDEIAYDDFTVMTYQFGETLNRALRKSDIMMQANRNQFFLLLPEIDESYVQRVVDRVSELWNKSEFGSVTVLKCATEFVTNEQIDDNDRRS